MMEDDTEAFYHHKIENDYSHLSSLLLLWCILFCTAFTAATLPALAALLAAAITLFILSSTFTML